MSTLDFTFLEKTNCLQLQEDLRADGTEMCQAFAGYRQEILNFGFQFLVAE
jgi:hypothetical protein